MFADKALAAKYLPASRQASVFYHPITQGVMKLKKNIVLTSKPLSSSINIIINQLLIITSRNTFCNNILIIKMLFIPNELDGL